MSDGIQVYDGDGVDQDEVERERLAEQERIFGLMGRYATVGDKGSKVLDSGYIWAPPYIPFDSVKP